MKVDYPPCKTMATTTQATITMAEIICLMFIFSFRKILANKNMKTGASMNKIVVKTTP